MVTRQICALLLALLLGPVLAGAGMAQTRIPDLSNPVAIGQAQLRVLGFLAYEGRLYTEGGARFDPEAPSALLLTYNRAFSARQLTRATETELRRIAPQASGLGQMLNLVSDCFRDVAQGDRYLAISPRPDELRLMLNGTETCRISYPEVGKRFLAIWLSDNSRFPRLSRQLRGL
ncbi:hypothetical protein SAMN05421774_10397 [Gemmobacter megaterium]|uniref:Chalcone isomerase-like n=1 Tax=Gemmobacter megaterium TaxID=1086013 RepID=A0A1N7N3H2_9RHOB|nr:hypothetical protein [Gemmobacter megaterium]GGE12865.1 hypothetical protein GCM10011345_18340 [Gemmobacter megaterium]SIS92892.1 hypothetical protein SAMN05421774_10397 [Gemmobacter megaterium]